MFESAIFRNGHRETAGEKLWRAVIARTLEEWVCGPLTRRRKAEQFLFDDNKDFRAVCFSAGINPGHLRKRLESIRARGIQKELSQLRVRGNKKSQFRQHAIFGQQALDI